MLWLALSAFFLWLAVREVWHGFVARPGFLRAQEISKGYLLLALGLATAFAYPPVRNWQFERFLTAQARVLSESPSATVHCNTLFDTMLDPNSMASGHATPATGYIVIQKPWCGVLRSHLRNPGKLDPRGIFSVQLFIHEAMHIRGELNEAITECQAIQRHFRGARLLGIPDDLAREGGRRFYADHYHARQAIGGMQAPYYSQECAPGKALDERLRDSTWN